METSQRNQQREGQQRATARNRVIPGATANRNQSDSFPQVRSQVSAFLCTASSRPPLGRRLRRRLGRAVGPSALHSTPCTPSPSGRRSILRGAEVHTGRPWDGQPTRLCNVSGGINAALKGSLRRPSAALDRCLLPALEGAPYRHHGDRSVTRLRGQLSTALEDPCDPFPVILNPREGCPLIDLVRSHPRDGNRPRRNRPPTEAR